MNALLPVAVLGLALAVPASAQSRSAQDPIAFVQCDAKDHAVWDHTQACDNGPSGIQERTGHDRTHAGRTASAAHPGTSRRDDVEANRALIRQVYSDFAAGNVEAVLAVLDPHVTWTEAEGFPYAGTYVGPGTVAQEVFVRLGTEWDAFEAVPSAFVADGSRVVVLGEYRGTYAATGRSATAPFAHVWQVMDGAVVRFRQFTDGPPWQRVVTP